MSEPLDWRQKPKGWAIPRWLLRGFVHRRPLDKASGLAFDTTFAAVPFLVLLVAILDAVGAYTPLRAEVLDPWLASALGPESESASLGTALRGLLETVDNADLAALGWGGLPVLLYAVILVFSAAEAALNDVFDAERHRPWERRLRDYFGFFLLLPVGAGMLTLVAAALHRLHVSDNVPDLAVHLVTVGVGILAMAAFYKGIANTPVSWRAAFVGGVIAAVLGYATFLVEMRAQMVVARYDALYAGLAALPLLLLWIFSSWLVILLGAEVSAFLVDWQNYGYRLTEPWPGSRLMAGVALGAVEAVAIAEVAERKPPRMRMIARRLGVPRAMLEQALGPLIRKNLIEIIGRDGQPRLKLIRGAEETQIDEVIAAIEGGAPPPSRLADAQQEPAVDAKAREGSLKDLVLGKQQP